MPRSGSISLSFPEFSGVTRQLVLINLGAYFVLLLAQFAFPHGAADAVRYLAFIPGDFLSGYLWQPLTYSFVHLGIWATFGDLLSLWIMGGLLEREHGGSWLMGLYGASVLGTTVVATAIYLIGNRMGASADQAVLAGCMGGVFGLLVALGVLHGEIEFLMFFLIGIKVKYLAAIYALIAIAMLFGEQRMYAFAQLGGAAAGLVYIRLMPRRGVGYFLSERLYGVRNRYYRWKRRKAAKNFEVYMRKQGRTVKFDGQGRQIDDDHDDKKRWN